MRSIRWLLCIILGHKAGAVEKLSINEGFYDWEQWYESTCSRCGERYEVEE